MARSVWGMGEWTSAFDQIAGLIKRGGTVYDLMETEHACAPPFSSAKDPIAIAGYVASRYNQRRNAGDLLARTGWEEGRA